MKKTKIIKGISFSLFLTVFLIFTGFSTGNAQDTKSKKSPKATVIIKINKGDGKTRVIDTTFVLTNPADHEKFDQYLKQFDGDLKSLEDNIKNMEVTVNIPDLNDSVKLDSLSKQIMVISKGFDHPHMKFFEKPGAFDYDYEFDMPDRPEFPEHFRWFEEKTPMPDRDVRMFRHERKGQSLNELLGDIPMDHVKSFSIKEKKNGKRITIDVSDYPFFEKHDKVIIMHDTPDHNGMKRIEKKIIIDDGKDKPDDEGDKD